jgi:hypothetical protein
MRNATCMSDYREVQHGFDMLAKLFSDKPKIDAFIKALDGCSPDTAQEAINLFDQSWKNIRLNTYIASISEHVSTEDRHGRLSMWRAVGNNTARVALVIRIPRFSEGPKALDLMFSPVAYLKEEEVPEVMDDVIKNIGLNVDFLQSIGRQKVIDAVFVMLRAWVTCLKYEGFGEEREWRAIYTPRPHSSPLMEIETKIIAGVPQIVYKIPLDAAVSDALADLDLSRMFDRLIIGPSPYPWVMYEAFTVTEALRKAGVEEAERRLYVLYSYSLLSRLNCISAWRLTFHIAVCKSAPHDPLIVNGGFVSSRRIPNITHAELRGKYWPARCPHVSAQA